MSIFVIVHQASATDLRGRIDGINQYNRSTYPLSRIRVELYVQTANGWMMVSGFVTGYDGMYYFSNVPPGNYTIQVNRRQNYPVSVYNQMYQDIPPITLNY